MNGFGLLNAVLSIALAVFIFGSVYFIKTDSKNKTLEQATPEFVSTKFSQTNLRTGPSLDYPIIYTYNQRHMPLKIIDTFTEWYQIEDIYGQKGWVYKNLVIVQKHAIVIDESSVYFSKNRSRTLAIIKPFNIVKILECSNDNICQIEFYVDQYNLNYKGYIVKSNLWGDTE
ncbi:MAG: SH3 domain-containing protein [Alphaproteobacteria bacterium]|nr:SH3 domain-containing protein [Alphaproteobacteria bacterium]